MLSFTRDQINTISKYLSINFNPKNPLGCMSVDTESGQIIYQTVNNITLKILTPTSKAILLLFSFGNFAGS
jgi:hypothetical protein